MYMYSIVIGQKSTNQIAQYMVGTCKCCSYSETSGTFDSVIFREYSDIVENDILTIQIFLDISRFLYSGGWQVCINADLSTMSEKIPGYSGELTG